MVYNGEGHLMDWTAGRRLWGGACARGGGEWREAVAEFSAELAES